jgi:2-(1,2-epoxy-1,2-dihydrophenyl)acetyl-CoA isomerase
VIATESRDGIVIVRLDRPGQRNAMVPEMVQSLVDHLRRAASSERPVILTGSDPAFCSGADLGWFAKHPDPAVAVADLVAVFHLAITTIVEMPVPVIAAINGATAGGGLGLALAPDYSIAAEAATFTAAYFRLGLTPDGGSSAFLERTIGPARTRELLLTNRRLNAREAFAWGMVNEVATDDQLLDRAVAFASGLQAVPSYVLLMARRLLDASYLRNQLQLESVAIRTAARGEYFRNALRQFLESHPEHR